MDRKDFINSIGMSAAAFALINCVGCKKNNSGSSDTAGSTGIDFGPASRSLTTYHTQLTGTSIRVYS